MMTQLPPFSENSKYFESKRSFVLPKSYAGIKSRVGDFSHLTDIDPFKFGTLSESVITDTCDIVQSDVAQTGATPEGV